MVVREAPLPEVAVGIEGVVPLEVDGVFPLGKFHLFAIWPLLISAKIC